MANIKITVEGPLMDGHKVTFKAPCNCDVVEKLDVRYIENNTQKSKLFTMKDSHGNDLTGLGNLFFKDAYVDVVLDTNSGSAYLQNAGTNSYLEERLKTAGTPVDNLLSDRADLPLSARQGKILNESLGGLRFGYDGDSNAYGYYGADDSFIPFSSGKYGTVIINSDNTFEIDWNKNSFSMLMMMIRRKSGIPSNPNVYAICIFTPESGNFYESTVSEAFETVTIANGKINGELYSSAFVGQTATYMII